MKHLRKSILFLPRLPHHLHLSWVKKRATRWKCICMDIYTTSTNLAGIPGISVPAAISSEGSADWIAVAGKTSLMNMIS